MDHSAVETLTFDMACSRTTKVWSTTSATATLYGSQYAPSPTEPLCLPPIASYQCSSSWYAWSSFVGTTTRWCERNGFWEAITTPPHPTTTPPPPLCPESPVNSLECGSLVSKWWEPYADDAQSWQPFDPKISLAPGCTLGCGRCFITGMTFELHYWPSTQAPNVSHPHTQPFYAIVDKSTTLTYPQVCLSYRDVYARDLCDFKGTTLRSGIIPINKDNLTTMLLNGDVERVGGAVVTALPPIGDVPEGNIGLEYFKVQEQSLLWSDFLWSQAHGFTNFNLVFPSEIETLEPAWASCGRASAGV